MVVTQRFSSCTNHENILHQGKLLFLSAHRLLYKRTFIASLYKVCFLFRQAGETDRVALPHSATLRCGRAADEARCGRHDAGFYLLLQVVVVHVGPRKMPHLQRARETGWKKRRGKAVSTGTN